VIIATIFGFMLGPAISYLYGKTQASCKVFLCTTSDAIFVVQQISMEKKSIK
jgi:hypothetical protein